MLEVNGITKVFGSGEARAVALDDVSFEVDDGDYVAVMGPSGSGKSTLLNVIGGLDRPSSGQVILNGQRIDNLDENKLVNVRRGKMAYVFQQYHLLRSLTALENVLLPLTFSGSNGKRARAVELLEQMGLGKRANHTPNQMSGGEQQRVAIARALVSDPALILADEPTGNVDQRNGKAILDIFEQMNREGRTIVMVTHNCEAAERAKEIIILRDGQIAERTRKTNQ